MTLNEDQLWEFEKSLLDAKNLDCGIERSNTHIDINRELVIFLIYLLDKIEDLETRLDELEKNQ